VSSAIELVARPPDAFRAFIVQELPWWREIIEATRLDADEKQLTVK
jgi:hypothetical protein